MNELEIRSINTLRFLSVDGVQKANSGHPGLPMGTAAIAYTIWTKHLNFNSKNPQWANRDRFVLSSGHGSMLLYSLLHLTGFGLTIDDLKQFRQWKSLTPGHPEYGLTKGVEATTGPLGQGLANGVGMGIAEAHLAAEFNRPGHEIVNHFVYAIVTDGDLMEGISSEAASLAGHLRLGKLIYLYDDNHISIDGSTDLSFTEDRGKRFEAYQWQVLHVEDGNNVDEIDSAIKMAKGDPRPSLIICRTHIGFGLPTRQDTSKAHGEPPGEEELAGAKKKLGWPVEPKFYVPEDVAEFYQAVAKAGEEKALAWEKNFKLYAKDFPVEAAEFTRRQNSELPKDWQKALPSFLADEKGMATRVASGIVLNALAGVLPEIMGGSADLTPSNNTWIKETTAFQPENPIGRYIHFGVREHGMGAIVNGLTYHKGLIAFGATFLVFTDYMRGAIRVGALSHLPSIWIMTHDSIGLGEDGPTHQPVEHLAALRAIPNLIVIRPSDANETKEAWRIAIENRQNPTLLALTRQALPTLDRSKVNSERGLQKGAYILAEMGKKEPEIILMASGSEVSLIYEAGKQLADFGHSVRVVSFPSWELFEATDAAYKESVFPTKLRKRLAVEAGIRQGWDRYIGLDGQMICMHGYGASAPANILFKEFGFTVENIVNTAKNMLTK
jgi:transketolase